MKTYGEQLRARRAALRLTQEVMADRMGYKRQGNLSLYENDKKRPSVKTVLRHASACGQKPSEFLNDVIVTDYDRIRAGEYDNGDRLEKRPKLSGEGHAPTRLRRQGRAKKLA